VSAEYPKVNSIYKRDQRGRFLIGEWSSPEFGYLRDLPWLWTEKVDGTNIRLSFDPVSTPGNEHAHIAGRTDSAQIPPFLLARLMDLMRTMPWEKVFPGGDVTLYGEGYGARIQKGGGNYIADGVDFVLFDVKVGDWWLRREDVEEVAEKLGLDVVPVVAIASIPQAIELVCNNGFLSRWPHVAVPEGLVGRPTVDLFDRRGGRITTKIKHKDFQ
jgi:hypothetical protein